MPAKSRTIAKRPVKARGNMMYTIAKEPKAVKKPAAKAKPDKD